MDRTRKLVIEILDNAVFFALFYGIFATAIYFFVSDITHIWWLLLMVCPFAAYFILRRVLRVFWIAIFFHAFIAVGMAFIAPGPIHPAVWLGVSAILAFFSLARFLSPGAKGGNELITFCAALFILLTIYAIRAENLQLISVYPVVITIVIIGRIAVSHMLQMDASLDSIRLASEQPIRRIISFDYKLVAGLSLVILTVGLVIYFLLVAPLLGIVEGLLPGRPQFEPAPREEVYQEVIDRPETDRDMPPPYFEDSSPPAWIRIAAYVLSAIFIAMGLAFGLYIAFMLLRRLLEFLNRRAKMAGIVSDGDFIEDEKEFILPTREKRLREMKISAKEEHPTRKLFRETAVKHIKMGAPIKKSDTPTEVVDTIRTRTMSENIMNLAEEYAKVRYK